MSLQSTSPLLRRTTLSIAYVPLERLKPDPGNARQHSAKQIRQIVRSIEAFGFNVPVLVDADLNVIAGHGRLLACKRLGWTEIPTIRLEHLSETQRRAFMIAGNRLTEIASWDDRQFPTSQAPPSATSATSGCSDGTGSSVAMRARRRRMPS